MNYNCFGDNSTALKGVKILLDPGHGVKNTKGANINKGSKGNGVLEQDVVVEIAQLLGEKLIMAGSEVYYTRNKSKFWRINDNVDDDNYNRAYEAEGYGADAFIRIHTDWNKKKSISGTTTYYLRRSCRGFAETIHKNLMNAIHRKDCGVTQNWYKGMEETSMPAVLIEVCFISNPQESKLLKQNEFLEKCAQGIYDGLLEYFNQEMLARKK
jgi:N-acetylmuramoyl-L-alanine amidase